MHHMTPEQSRMARAALNWTIQQLADKAGVGRNSIARFEAGGDARFSTVTHLKKTLEAAGVEFIAENGGGPGVRLKKPAPSQA
jgi:transcriptional regulator with XRE-family HTH domain